jgi:hypothetical protein
VSRRVVLFPSPILAGSGFFDPLARELRAAGHAASVIHIAGQDDTTIATSAAQQLNRAAGDDDIVLVPYSGAGPLAPAVLAGFEPGRAAVVFLDAGLPHPGRSRLDELLAALPPDAYQPLESLLRAGGAWPNWSDEELTPLVADAAVRRTLLSLVTPRSLRFFEAPLPSVELPAATPCAYLRLSPAYDAALAMARSGGWPASSLDLHHFAPYTNPREVAHALTTLVGELHG